MKRFSGRLCAMIAAAVEGGRARLDALLLRLSAECRALAVPPDQMVAALKSAWRTATPPAHVNEEAWRGVYRETLTRVLALYFNEAGES